MSRMLARLQRHALEAEQVRVVAEALRETGSQATGPHSAALDRRALRGIPMIGGASGAKPGSVPHQNRRLARWQGRLRQGPA